MYPDTEVPTHVFKRKNMISKHRYAGRRTPRTKFQKKNLLNKHNTIDNKTYYLPTPII